MRRLLLLPLFAALALTAAAQPATGRNAPRLGFAYPAGAQAGTTVTLTLGGQFLAEASALHFSSGALSARLTGYERPLTQKESVDLREEAEQLRKRKAANPSAFPAEDARRLSRVQEILNLRNPRPGTPSLAEAVTCEITIAADAAPGVYELRLQTPAGLSNPLVFVVGTLPETTTPAATVTNSPPRRANAAAVKRSPPVEVALPALVNGQILPGEIDAVRFAARRGQQLVCSLGARSLIPYLADAVPGWFQAALRLRDAQGREIAFADDYQFRPDPVLACTIPADGTYTLEIHDAIYRGREDFVYRLTVGELPFIQSVYPLGAARQATTSVALRGWNLPAERLAIETGDRPAGPMLLTVRRAGHVSNGVRFAVGAGAELNEDEERTAPQAIALPTVVNGRIARPDESDIYRFTGRAGDHLVAEIFARRLDSPLDSRLELHGPDGRLLAANDDTDDPDEGLITHHADSRLLTQLPADGDYTLTVHDTQHHGGPDHAYRLALHSVAPDFALRVTPSAVNLPAGGSAVVTVHALRRDGFTGAIELALDGPAAGFRLDGARIPAGADSVQLTLSAAPNQPTGRPHALELKGTANIDGRTVTRPARACDDTMQAFLYRHLVPASRWLAFVNGRGTAFRVSTPAPVVLRPGRTTVVRIESNSRGPALDQPAAELVNPPPGVSVESCRSRGNTVEVTLALETGAARTPPAGNLVLALSGVRGNRGKGEPKPRPLGLVSAFAYTTDAVPAPAR